ncbi:MAG: substrate-binding domain-containing protein [Gammaproteobacteria bacterium]|nr:substrate-binding domain-containing protein [Gammaproteobacteria bacterium]
MSSLNRLFFAPVLACVLSASHGIAAEPIVGLIVKTNTNPFFVTMKQAALEKAGALGIELRTFSGAYDGDTQTQIEAIESLVNAGAKGILITPSDPAVLADVVARAREAGVMVVALDTPFDPSGSVDATFATDNFRAGELIGLWAMARLGDSAKRARIATLDGYEAQITVDVLRNQGFLRGFGIDIRDQGKMQDEDDPRIVGSARTWGTEEGGRVAMDALMRMYPGIDVAYAINEPAATGAYAALKALGMEKDVMIVTVDGSCHGVRDVAAGAIGATAMQYPVRMASLGVEAVIEFVRTGRRPENTPGLGFTDTGVTLVTDLPVPGIPSLSSEKALKECWDQVP